MKPMEHRRRYRPPVRELDLGTNKHGDGKSLSATAAPHVHGVSEVPRAGEAGTPSVQPPLKKSGSTQFDKRTVAHPNR